MGISQLPFVGCGLAFQKFDACHPLLDGQTGLSFLEDTT